MPQLIVEAPGQPVRVFGLRPGPNLLGRAADNAVVIANDSLSRRHACVIISTGRAMLNDLGSKNGTLVHGRRVSEVELHDGMRFTCGAVELEYQVRSIGSREPAHEIHLSQRHPRIDDFLVTSGGSRPSDAAKRQDAVERTSRFQRARDLIGVIETLAELGPGDAFERILSSLFEVMDNVEYAALLSAESCDASLELRAARSRGAASACSYSHHVIDYVCEHATAVLFAGQGPADARFASAESIIDQHIRASMCVPFSLSDGGFAVMYVDTRAEDSCFGPEDLEFLCVFCRYAAMKLDNVSLLRKLEEEAVLRSNLLRFFPSSTALQLLASGGDTLKPMKLRVTALFCDLCEFTALSTTVDPTQVIEILNDYFRMLASIVFRHGGTLEKYIGDAVLAVWGAPLSSSDDAERAALAAIEMQRSFVELARAWERAGSHVVGIHIGLDTGVVAAGNIGSDRYLQYATIGEPTTLASRICGQAGRGEILISDSTRDEIAGRELVLESVPPLQVKGRAQPLAAWRLVW